MESQTLRYWQIVLSAQRFNLCVFCVGRKVPQSLGAEGAGLFEMQGKIRFQTQRCGTSVFKVHLFKYKRFLN